MKMKEYKLYDIEAMTYNEIAMKLNLEETIKEYLLFALDCPLEELDDEIPAELEILKDIILNHDDALYEYKEYFCFEDEKALIPAKYSI